MAKIRLEDDHSWSLLLKEVILASEDLNRGLDMLERMDSTTMSALLQGIFDCYNLVDYSGHLYLETSLVSH